MIDAVLTVVAFVVVMLMLAVLVVCVIALPFLLLAGAINTANALGDSLDAKRRKNNHE